MKRKKARKFISRWTYKPKSVIRIEMHPVLVLFTKRKDAYGKKRRTVWLRSWRPLMNLDQMDKTDLANELVELVEQQETHEATEWLKFDGKRVTEPHD
ncbi:MAG: hypothetical protein ACXVGB_00010 [Mycobacteriaceae bacterium]